MSNITFVIFTYNEESRIERVIKNLKGYGKILINDNNSIDATREIALSYGCEVLIRDPDSPLVVENEIIAHQLYNAVTTEWIYWGYADEMLEKKTLVEITSIIKLHSDKYDIIGVEKKNYNYGVFCYNVFHCQNNRIFKKHALDFSNNPIHGMGRTTVAADRIFKMDDEFFVHHFSNYTVSTYLNTLNKYTDIEITNMRPYRKSMWSVFGLVTKRMLKNYIFEGGYKAGFAGMQAVLMFLCYQWVVNIKLYEKENNYNRSVIEKKNDNVRDEILSEFL